MNKLISDIANNFKHNSKIWYMSIGYISILSIPLILGSYNDVIGIPELVLVTIFGAVFFFNITTLIYANKYGIYKKRAEDLGRFILTFKNDDWHGTHEDLIRFLKVTFPDITKHK